jgi:hypothetical protein
MTKDLNLQQSKTTIGLGYSGNFLITFTMVLPESDYVYEFKILIPNPYESEVGTKQKLRC